jgi:hypothetical protein
MGEVAGAPTSVGGGDGIGGCMFAAKSPVEEGGVGGGLISYSCIPMTILVPIIVLLLYYY